MAIGDLLTIWVDDQTWGGPVEKLVMLYIAGQTTEPDRIAYEVVEEDLASYAEVNGARIKRTMQRLARDGHLVAVVGRDGPGWMVGGVFRREPIVIRFAQP